MFCHLSFSVLLLKIQFSIKILLNQNWMKYTLDKKIKQFNRERKIVLISQKKLFLRFENTWSLFRNAATICLLNCRVCDGTKIRYTFKNDKAKIRKKKKMRTRMKDRWKTATFRMRARSSAIFAIIINMHAHEFFSRKKIIYILYMCTYYLRLLCQTSYNLSVSTYIHSTTHIKNIQ